MISVHPMALWSVTPRCLGTVGEMAPWQITAWKTDLVTLQLISIPLSTVEFLLHTMDHLHHFSLLYFLGPLYPIGGTIMSESDDGDSPRIPLLQSFKYFGQSYPQIYVNQNGHLTFNAAWSSYFPQHFPMYGTRDIIAPFWTDLDNRENGEIYYVQYTNGSLLQQVTQDINTYFPDLNFQANWIFIATWHEVAYFSMTGTQTTFQAVLTTNNHSSFVLMNYGSIASIAGYDTINSPHHFTIRGSFSSQATGPNSVFRHGSNVNEPGRWAFCVNHECNFGGKNTMLNYFIVFIFVTIFVAILTGQWKLCNRTVFPQKRLYPGLSVRFLCDRQH
uniref:NIDO domain-containing protein n=1 Tax=Poecilia latipinna TaxID=48699 RepID=A0A3B3U007_9TELE